jgi:hypothetical protein
VATKPIAITLATRRIAGRDFSLRPTAKDLIAM